VKKCVGAPIVRSERHGPSRQNRPFYLQEKVFLQPTLKQVPDAGFLERVTGTQGSPSVIEEFLIPARILSGPGDSGGEAVFESVAPRAGLAGGCPGPAREFRVRAVGCKPGLAYRIWVGRRISFHFPCNYDLPKRISLVVEIWAACLFRTVRKTSGPEYGNQRRSDVLAKHQNND